MTLPFFENPFRPVAGHQPPYLAGRTTETEEISKHFDQKIVIQNVVLTGLRGVGKTVLLESLKPYVQQKEWLWTTSDMSEVASLSDENMATRLLTDISIVTSGYTISEEIHRDLGFLGERIVVRKTLNYDFLLDIYQCTPGLISDKLKKVIEIVWHILKNNKKRGIIFAYDEAQNLCDHPQQNLFPLSILLDVFQSLQKKEIPVLLVMTGLPTLFPKLVDTRTYAERMFNIVFLNHLDRDASRQAILKPIEDANCPIKFTDDVVETIINVSGGYPYFIQYLCKEIYDIWIMQKNQDIPISNILCKLDTDFFQGRWIKATDRQRDLLRVIAELDNCDEEFTVQEIAVKSKGILQKGFTPSHISQMLISLAAAGLVYKNRKGKYSLAVPLLSQFIKRQVF